MSPSEHSVLAAAPAPLPREPMRVAQNPHVKFSNFPGRNSQSDSISISDSNSQDISTRSYSNSTLLKSSQRSFQLSGIQRVAGNSTTDPSLGNGRLCNEKTGCQRPTGVDMKMLSLQMIRHEILRKLRMDENRLPNVTGKGFPIPPDYINEFIDMPNDSPRDDYDDDHATTEKIIAFSRVRK
ncbi:unnamed protein product [Allacma fusca]|uniref:Uncharacterized protein n=1 Tax=Allacma fusca TaxID=39272 RepID=A0A8J2P6Z5_9HEXA|nr:unnamed protein product [Allacma fusca]